jgi:hypothetical protein
MSLGRLAGSAVTKLLANDGELPPVSLEELFPLLELHSNEAAGESLVERLFSLSESRMNETGGESLGQLLLRELLSETLAASSWWKICSRCGFNRRICYY